MAARKKVNTRKKTSRRKGGARKGSTQTRRVPPAGSERPEGAGHSSVFTPQRARKLCDALRESPNIAAACRRVGISRKTYYNWMKDNEDFAKDVHEAMMHSVDRVEAQTIALAAGDLKRDIYGNVKGVTQKVGEEALIDFRAQAFILSHWKRDRYRREDAGTGDGQGGVLKVNGTQTEADWEEAYA